MSVFPPPCKTSDIFPVAYLLVRSCYVTESTEHFFYMAITRKHEAKAMTPPQGLI